MELSVNRNQKRGLLASTPASLRDRRSKGKREGILSARKARGAREEGGKGSPPSPLSSLLPRAPLAFPRASNILFLLFRTPTTQTIPIHTVHKEKTLHQHIFKVKAPYQLHRLFSAV